MNYIPEYFEIIGNRLANPLPEGVKGEVHHIFPKSLGGSNKKSNLVKLTSAEHFRCHELLVEMYRGNDENAFQRMVYAWNMISHTRDGLVLTAEEYQRYRDEYSKIVSASMKGNHYSLGLHWTLSEETRKNMSKPKSEEHRKKLADNLRKVSEQNKGKPLSEEHRRKIGESQKGRVQSEKTRQLISAAHKGEVKSEEHRRKISETLTGRKDPLEVREKKSAALRKRWDNMSEEKRREISEKHKAYWARKRLESNGSTK